MTNLGYDIIVFGSTSFVGQILNKYPFVYFSGQTENLRWAIAGRSKVKLEEAKNSLGAEGQSLPIIMADAANETHCKIYKCRITLYQYIPPIQRSTL